MNVLITGAASGIGYEVSKYLLEKNVNLIVLDILDNPFDERVTYFQVDITNNESIDKIFKQLSRNNVLLDAIINIAGIFNIDSFIEIDEPSLKRIFEVNLFATINVNKTFFKLLNKNGRIIITSSEVAPLDPLPFNGIYNVTKTSLDAYSQALRQELNLLGIKVITIRPGAFKTNLSMGSLDKTKELMSKTVLYHENSKKFYTLVKKFMGEPKDPIRIAKTYHKALIKRNPRYVYYKNRNILLVLLSILPIRLQCFIIKMLLKNNKH